MGFSTAGVYTPATGATTATPGSVIQSAVWNAIFTDLTTALTQTMGQLMNSFSVQKNVLFGNGGLEVWQRGAGGAASVAVAASTTAYTADRWYITTGTGQASTIAQVAGLNDGSRWAAKVQRNSGQTGTGTTQFGYPLDTDSIIPMRGKKVSVRLTLSTGADWSPASGNIVALLAVGTGAVGKYSSGFTSQTLIINTTIAMPAGTAATTTTIAGSVTVPLTATQAEFQVYWIPVGTAGTNDWFTIDDVEVEVNNTGTASTWLVGQYDRAPYSVMLADCLNHYNKTFAYSVAPATAAGYLGAMALIANATSRQGLYYRNPVEMRTTPTYTTYSPTNANSAWYDVTGTSSLVATVTATSTKGIFVYSATAAAVDRIIYIHVTADAGI